MSCSVKKSSWVILLLLFGSGLLLNGEKVAYHPIRYDNLYSSRQIIQDDFGYFWSWSNGTIYRLDPYEAEQIGSFAQYPVSTGGRNINFFRDVKGMIWLVYYDQREINGVNGYDVVQLDIIDPVAKKIMPFDKYFDAALPFRPGEVFSINQTDGTTLWISTEGSALYRYDGQFTHQFTLQGDQIFAQAGPSKDGDFWLVATGSILKTDSEGNIQECFPADVSWGEFLWDDVNQSIWYCDSALEGSQVSCLSFDGNLITDSLLVLESGQTPYQLFRGPPGGIWLVNSDNLILWQAQKGIILNLGETDLFTVDDGTIRIFQLYQSSSADFLVAANHWIKLLQIKENRFQNYLEDFKPSMRGLVPVNDSIFWCNSYSGVFWLNTFSGKSGPLSTAPFYQQNKLLPRKEIYGLGVSVGPDGRTYSGMEAYFLSVYDFTADRWQAVEFLSKGKKRVPLYTFFDQNKKLWIGTTKGLFTYNKSDQVLKEFSGYSGSSKLEDLIVRQITQTSTGYWLTTDRGLYLLNIAKQEVEKYGDFPFSDFEFLYIDKAQQFWLATRGRGIIKWDKTHNETTQITEDDGLSNNFTHVVLEDDFGYLWVSTNHGLNRINKATLEIEAFYKEDGLPDSELNYLSHWQDTSSGTIYLGTVKGVTSFNPEDFLEEHRKNDFPLVLKEVKVLKKGIWENVDLPKGSKKNIELSSDINSISLEFALLRYSTPLTYAYQLENYDENWRHTEDPLIQYQRLPVGHYRLLIKGRGGDGQWSSQEISIGLVVLRPFYLQVWFILLCIAGLGFTIWSFFKLRMVSLEKRAQELEKVVQERTADLAASNQTKDKLFAVMGHELRGGIASYYNLSENISYLIKKGDYGQLKAFLDAMKQTSRHLSLLLDDLLEWGLIQSGQFPYRPEYLDFINLVEETFQLYQPVANEKGVSLSHQCSANIKLWADRKSLLSILRNLISNALKFTPSGQSVTLFCMENLDEVMIVVRDQGIGIPPENLTNIFSLKYTSTIGTNGEKGTGLGLNLCKELVLLNRGNIQITSELEKGTVVTLIFPKGGNVPPK